MPKGAPSKLTPERKKKFVELVRLEMTHEEIAEILGVSTKTLTNWKNKHQDLLLDIKTEKYRLNRDVKKALLSRAKGFTHEYQETVGDIEVTKKKFFPPDPASAMFWLKTQAGWRENDQEQLGNITVNFNFPRPNHQLDEDKVIDAEEVKPAALKAKNK